MTAKLLLGIVNCDGRIEAGPVVVDIDNAGQVASWRRLDGHEPHSATVERALLSLSDLKLITLPEPTAESRGY